jgi:F420-non-reducing hydrogenase iron-sulfur subunit
MSPQKILLIHCDWSTEGDFRPEIPDLDITSLAIKCLGRVDPVLLLDSFSDYDGALLIGCPIGDCHFIEGNKQARLKVKMTQKIMEIAGLEPTRLAIKWASPSDEGSALRALNDYIDHFSKLGEKERVFPERLFAARATMENVRMRSFVSNEMSLTEKGNVYGEKLAQTEFDEVADEALELEYYRNWIHTLLKTDTLSVKHLAERIRLDTQVVLEHIVVLTSRGWIMQDHVEGMTPLYTAMEVQ